MPVSSVMINDAVRRQVLLERLKAGEAEKFAAFLREIDINIRVRLTSATTDLNRARMAALANEIGQMTRGVITRYNVQLMQQMDMLALSESRTEAAVLNSTITQRGFESVIPDANQLLQAFRNDPLSIRGKGQGLTLDGFLAQFTDDQVNLVRGRITQGIVEGQTNDQIIRSLRGTRAARFSDGVLGQVDRNTRIMVRTAVQEAASVAREQTWQANADIIKGVQWVSTLDGGTTQQCQALDGREFPLDSGPRPPIHYGCRSTTVPVLSSDLDYLDRDATRSAEDGPVDAKTTYYDWLKTQSVEFQDDTLGPGRGKLFRDGGISAEKFAALQLNSNFMPVSLAEMERKAEAYKRANLSS